MKGLVHAIRIDRRFAAVCLAFFASTAASAACGPIEDTDEFTEAPDQEVFIGKSDRVLPSVGHPAD